MLTTTVLVCSPMERVVIGGHCVTPNIEILSHLGPSDVLKAMRASNKKKIQREAGSARPQAGAGLSAAGISEVKVGTASV
jgi:hypothetical protein